MPNAAIVVVGGTPFKDFIIPNCENGYYDRVAVVATEGIISLLIGERVAWVGVF